MPWGRNILHLAGKYLFPALVSALLAGPSGALRGGDPPGCHLHGCRHAHALFRVVDYVNPLDAAHLSAYDVKAYDIRLEVSNQSTEIGGRAVVVIEMLRDCDTIVLELRDELSVSKADISIYPAVYPEEDGDGLRFTHSDHALYIHPAGTLGKGQVVQVAVFYQGDAGGNGSFFSGYSQRRDSNFGFLVSYTLSEPFNARDWFPVKQVLMDKMDSLSMHFIVDEQLLVASNGILVRNEVQEGKRHLTWKSKHSMAYYLPSLSVADYRDFSFMAPLSRAGDSVLVQNYIYDTDEILDLWEEDIRATGAMMGLFSELFGDYPFADEKYGHALAPMGGGMEHQTMTTIANFNFYLVAHELAHQWFGDWITCGSWQDIWINEGFASYMEYVAAQGLLGQDEADAWMQQARSVAFSATEGSVYVPSASVENVSRLFSYELSYRKGAMLLHMIRFMVDDDTLFFSILRNYLALYANSGATGMEFKAVLEAGSGLDFSSFFDQWYFGEGYPRMDLAWRQSADTLHLTAVQTTSHPEVTPLFNIPFEVELLLGDGRRERVRLEQVDSETRFQLPVSGQVRDLVFDPDGCLLANGTVNELWMSEKPYLLGPNPAGGVLNIRFFEGSRAGDVRLIGMDGKQYLKLLDLPNPCELSLSGLRSGPYILEITRSSERFQEKVIVQHN